MSRVPAELLIRKLESIGSLSAEERDGLRRLECTRHFAHAHEDIVREGDSPHSVTLLLSGFVCRYKFVADGKRQIMSFHIPGDIADLQSLFIPTADHSV